MKGLKKNADSGSRRYRIELSFTGLVGVLTLLVLGLVWVFIFGVLVGRGYQPENTVPELAKIMPPPAEEKAAPPTDKKILRPEELQFFDDLQKAAPDAPASGPEKKAAAKPAPAPKAESKPEPKAGKKTEPAISTVAEKIAPAAQEQPVDPDQARYSYVYQTASFRDLEAANELKGRIEALGIRTRLETVDSNGKSWHRVNVLFQGTPEETRGLKAKLETLGLYKPIMRDKQPLN